MASLLLVEDDLMLSETLAKALSHNQWQVDCATDVAGARIALVDHGYAAVLLDLGLTDGTGFDVLKSVRERYDTVPVLIMTARDQLKDRIRGLDAGADDYVVKPFSIDELMARLRAVLRRTEGRVTPVLRYQSIELDPAQRKVTRDGKDIRLGAHEYRTLLALMERQGKCVARTQLELVVYGDCDAIESNTIAVYVHQLRRKLGDDIITTIHGYGYRFGEEV